MDDDDNETAFFATPSIELQGAIEAYLKAGGVIHHISIGVSGAGSDPWKHEGEVEDIETTRARKVEHLKELIAKGAGISALQYSLRMNKRELRRMAVEQNVKIPYSRPIPGSPPARHPRRAPLEKVVDDEIAGTIMHLGQLGHSPMEIAQALSIRVRQVWIIAKEYKFTLITPTENE